ncbi:hypothetical protein LTR17_021361 [Elasticomyces elasticus]|nr:hypothetical protein LTR17_021361 [Elasticomyces elasticus]
MGENQAYTVREVESDEKSTVVPPNGPSSDVPTAPYILTGTINGGLPPRLPAQPLAPPAPDIPPPRPLGHADTGRFYPVVSTASNQSSHECVLLLRRFRQETGSDMNFEYFVMLDVRSLGGDTVLMVESTWADEYGFDNDDDSAAEEQDDPQALRIHTLRAAMRLFNSTFMPHKVEGNMRKDIERLEEEGNEDGVLRS